jgi:pyruvate/2-oxoglutarate dehydrogenase complex dihydrolipoamide dehydrogenase (E3) component
MRRLRAAISSNDSVQRFTRLGVDVFLGAASFTGPQTIDVGGQTLRFKRCIIATGARPAVPDVPGLAETGYLTNETVFSLTELPPRLVVIGGGPVGCELAQAFRRFGSRVTLIHRGERLLPKDDSAAAAILDQQLRREEIEILYGASLLKVETTAGAKQLVLKAKMGERTIEADAILVAVGRIPNVSGLGLEQAGVQYASHGIAVNDYLQTTNPRIFAAGDCLGSFQFTHAADAMARACIQNAFFSVGPFGRRKLSDLVIPWTTYTDPEIAHVGLTPTATEQRGIAIDTYREELRHIDRALLDGDDEGFAVIHCRRGTPRVLGCTIVARHAGEMIAEITLLMTARLPISSLAKTIHCYPTQVEVLKRLGDQYNKSRLSPRIAYLLKSLIAARR